MSNPTEGPIEELGRRVEEVAGPDIRAVVMAGSEAPTEATSSTDLARWTKSAMERLEAAVPAAAVVEIMGRCGRTCARMNSASVDETLARRQQHATEDAFLAAEVLSPPAGTTLEREGNALRQFYTPRRYHQGLRCYCGIVEGLPEDETMSLSYCHCSRAFVQTVWERALGRPVTVELVQSAISGADECEFRITT